MTLPILQYSFLLFLIVFLSGCGGYDRVLFATKTNVGLDIDNKPPTAELTIARRELAIQPTYSDYNSDHSGLPLLAAFGMTGNFFNPSITGHFAGGDAAVYLVQEGDNEVNSAVCLSKKPEDPRGPLLKFWHWLTFQNYEEIKHEPRPFYFATDSSYGIKVAWSGTAGPYPDSLKLGYNRKEFASPPVFVEDIGSCKNQSMGKDGYQVKIPSFYAAIDNAGGYTTFTESGVRHVQFFATGKAATEFAKRDHVKAIAFNHMAPEAAQLKTKHLGLNQALIGEIEREFNKAGNQKKSEILAEAKKLKLVEEKIKSSEFVKALQKHASSPDPDVSTRLIKVRHIAVTSQK